MWYHIPFPSATDNMELLQWLVCVHIPTGTTLLGNHEPRGLREPKPLRSQLRAAFNMPAYHTRNSGFGIQGIMASQDHHQSANSTDLYNWEELNWSFTLHVTYVRQYESDHTLFDQESTSPDGWMHDRLGQEPRSAETRLARKPDPRSLPASKAGNSAP